MTDDGSTASPSPSSSGPSPAASLPPSAASWISLAVSALVSLFTAWKVAATLPTLAERCDWKMAATAFASLVLIAVPTSVVPVTKALAAKIGASK